ncbi:MAG: hypothetical protein JWP98_1221, partial [Edaphobacter sp.]|nr:hypothetical protein [Edaphobacter sp.]
MPIGVDQKDLERGDQECHANALRQQGGVEEQDNHDDRAE